MFDAASDTFTYTLSNEDTGSWVDQIYYDETDQSLVVVLEDERWPYESRTYKYEGVPKDVVEKFLVASSFGVFYNTRIKSYYPSESLGDPIDLEFVEREQTLTSVGNGWSASSSGNFATGPVTPNYTSLRTVESVQNTEGFTPKAMSGPFVGEGRVSLAPAPAQTSTREYEVKFLVQDSDRVRTTQVEAENLIGAAEALLELGEMLDVTVDVVGVTLVS